MDNQAIVVSVSIGKGCYRHIRIPANETLEVLAAAILWAFGFENDHAHAFFMNNRAWDKSDCYFMAEVDVDGKHRHTCDVTLRQIGLQKGDAFKFIFDFGDEWQFQCKVMRIEAMPCENIEIVRMTGKAPKQYP